MGKTRKGAGLFSSFVGKTDPTANKELMDGDKTKGEIDKEVTDALEKYNSGAPSAKKKLQEDLNTLHKSMSTFTDKTLLASIATHNSAWSALTPSKLFSGNITECNGECVKKNVNIRKSLQKILDLSKDSPVLGYLGKTDAARLSGSYVAENLGKMTGVSSLWKKKPVQPTVDSQSTIGGRRTRRRRR
jgi:hypothetical protein